MENVNSSLEPLLFKKLLTWDVIKWDVEQWRALFATEPKSTFTVRKGSFKCSQTPTWERECTYESMTFAQFFDRFSSNDSQVTDWLYFDYKHISAYLTEETCSKINIAWNDVGLTDKTAKDSTLWMGTRGAHTPCHIDTYGCNFVAQIYGRKRWLLFPPSETVNLKPVRVPYEESSVYSSFNFFRGCAQFPESKEVILVDLEPGDMLYVPKGWWHYVENLTSAISVNIWIPKESDVESRLKECIVKYLVRCLVKDMDAIEAEELLNPNEEDLTTMDSQDIVDQLNWCASQKPSRASSQANSDRQLLTNVPPKLSLELIKTKMNAAHICHISATKPRASCERLNMVKAICHPDVIDIITEKFLELCSVDETQ